MTTSIKAPAPAAPIKAPTVAPVTTPAVTVASFRAALAVVDSGDVRGLAGTTLKSLALARYAVAADKVARTIPGAEYAVLDTQGKRAAALSVWEDAGYGEVPKTESRTPSARSLSTYLSTFGSVATSFGFGTSTLSSLKETERAAETIAAASKEVREDAAYSALVRWRNSLPQAVAEALSVAADAFTTAEGSDHFTAWSATVRAAMPAK